MTTNVSAAVIEATQLTVRSRDGELLVDGVTLTLRAGELVAIVGPSGAGKTTLLQALAGIRDASDGIHVRAPGVEDAGYVPQDDIVHLDLTVTENVRFSALLRFGRALGGAELDAHVTRLLDDLGLSARSDAAVSSLSGGQRKRVSIATELVARPSVCFLDEPTSGLDPVTTSELLETLQALASSGTAVVMATHNLADLRVADRLLVVAPGGRIQYDGSPRHAPAPYGAHAATRGARSSPSRSGGPALGRVTVPRPIQAAVLARRNLILLCRNRTSAAIMAGSPVAVVAMMAILFRSGSGDPAGADPDVTSALAYWLAFAAFFFGLTFGLLQICNELPILRRELRAGVDLDAYLAAKAVVLLPALCVIDTTMVTVLTAIGRIPAQAPAELAVLAGLLGLGSLAGLMIGLLASATVTGAVQATLALPMLCFPAVLFGGAIVPVGAMTLAGRAIAFATSTRWSFESVSAELGGGQGAGLLRPSLALGVIVVLAAVGARTVLAQRTARRST